MKPTRAPKCVMIVAGEASGDLHGSRLVEAMRTKDDSLFFCGIGGPLLESAGVRILVEASALSVVGITEVFSKASGILKGMALVKKALGGLRPDLLILIDFPDFNLHVAALAKKLKIPVLYYISPQVWAWRSGRVRKIKRRVDHLAVILPFEAEYYREHDIPVTFVGHPLVDSCSAIINGPFFQQKQDRSVIALLPGSRESEIDRHLPVMLEAADLLSRRKKGLRFTVSLAPGVERAYVAAVMARHKKSADCRLVGDGVDRIFKECGFAVVASGTASLETAIYGIPMVIMYRVSSLSYWLGRMLIRVAHIGLVNLIAGRKIIPELIQKEASPENIAETVAAMLDDSAGLDRLKTDLECTRKLLGGPGASARTADIALRLLEKPC